MKANRNVYKLKASSPAVFTLIGISSHENDYRLSWSLNEHMRLSFTKSYSLITDLEKVFTIFVHEDDDKSLTLVSNLCDDGFLLEKHKNLDFILKFDVQLSEAELSAWLHDLKKIPLISTAYIIPIDKRALQLFG